MRLFEFLKPGEIQDNILDHDKLREFIIHNCSDFLKEAKGKLLRRGIKSNKDIFLGRSRNNREPSATDAEASKLIDEKLSSAGFIALRSNSIFCSASEQINEFGKEYIIYPINGYSFTWSLQIRDLTRTLGLTTKAIELYKDNDFRLWPDQDYAKRLLTKTSNSLKNLEILSPIEYVEHYRFRKDHMIAALNSGNEILINGSYVAIRFEYKHYDLVKSL